MRTNDFSWFYVLALVAFLCPVSFGALWSIDFQDGWNASSGDVVLVSGNAADPYDANSATKLVDMGSGDYALRTGDFNIAGEHALAHHNTGVIMPPSGKITARVYAETAGRPTGSFVILANRTAVGDGENYSFWYFGMTKNYKYFVRSGVPSDPGTISHYAESVGQTPIGMGWHDFVFEWTQTQADGGGGSGIREKADLKLTVDGAVMLEVSDGIFAPGGEHFSAGSWWQTETTAAHEAGFVGALIDDVVVEAPPAVCGDMGTVYLNADIDKNCYVNFDDLKLFALQWLESDIPVDGNCTLLAELTNDDCMVDMADYAAFSNEWLKTTNPADCGWTDDYIFDEIILQQDEVTILEDDSLYLDFNLPYCQEKVYLSLEVRLLRPGMGSTGAAISSVRYYVNDLIITDPDLMVNVPDAINLISRDGRLFTWSGANNNWRASMSNIGFVPYSVSSTPLIFGSWPYPMVLDISDYVNQGALNNLRIKHHYPDGVGTSLVVRNVKILSSYDRPAPDPTYDEVPDLGGEPVIPATVFDVNYSASVTSGGGILVNVSGDEYKIESKFSYPNGTFNKLEADGPAQGEWIVVTDTNSVTGTGSNYKLERSVIRHNDRVEIQDKLTNLTNEIIGIRLGHDIKEMAGSLTRTYMHGQNVPIKESATTMQAAATGNPSVYISKESSGIALLARDNVLRSHIGIQLKNGSYGIHDRYYALDANSSYTMKWEIYPTEQADYYDFINAARRALNGNFLIDGLRINSHGHTGNMEGVTDDDIRNPIIANNAKYVAISTQLNIDANGYRINDGTGYSYTHGTGFTSDYGYWGRYWFEQVLARYRSVVPDVKLIPYTVTYLTSEPNALITYADSYPQRNGGSPQIYREGLYDMPVMYASWDNSYGPALDIFYDWLKARTDGIYIDISTSYNDTVAGFLSYRDDTWDNHTCQMNGSNTWNETGTYEFERTLTHSGLYTLDYRTSQIQDAKDANLPVWCNHAAATEDEAQLQSYRFIEASINNNTVYAHLGSPLGYGNQNWEDEENDLGRAVWYKLTYGGLYCPVGTVYETGGNILQDMYPIHPIELHCGYIVGLNKIITRVSGEYGFGDSSALTVKIYDKDGFYLPGRLTSVYYNATLGSNLADVILNEGELAIIVR